MIYPPKLKTGNKVGIVAPGRKVSQDQVEGALHTLQKWGLDPVLAKNIFSQDHSYLAGSDDQRRQDFQRMIDDPDVSAVFCARGGYGSTRIIEEIDFTFLKQSPKWIVGFSDITAFHLHLQSMGVASIHGTMPIFFGRPEAQASVKSLRKILFDGICNINFNGEGSNRVGDACGEVIGGNLSLLLDSFGTASEPDTRNKILVIEEVDEYYYKLDRMFTQLRRSGKLKNLAGLVVGHMTDMKNSDLVFSETVAELVLHAVRDYSFPVAFSFPSGHQNPNLAWIHGAPATLKVSTHQASLDYPTMYAANA